MKGGRMNMEEEEKKKQEEEKVKPKKASTYGDPIVELY